MSKFCISLLAIIGLSVAEVPTNQCPKFCPALFKPVCGFDGEHYRVFDNECLMKSQECADHLNWKIEQNLMKCMLRGNSNEENKNQCPVACPAVYSPVCATDGQTFQLFPNECEMNAEACVKRLSLTKTDDIMQCLKRADSSDGSLQCERIYEPVCATDGQKFKLFNNVCFMKKQNEQDENKWSLSNDFFNCYNFPSQVEEVDAIPACPTICPEVYAPVCATDGKTFKLFTNECEMKIDACEKRISLTRTDNIMKCLHKADKGDASQQCENVFEPVCATNGEKSKLFKNICFMKVQNEQDGEKWKTSNNFFNCFTTAKTIDYNFNQCPKICPALYAPVCGFDGQNYKLFDNSCMMRTKACLDNHKWTRINDLGKCLPAKAIEASVKNDDKKEECPKICPALFAPLCGFDGERYKFFTNECLLKSENCNFGRGWQIERNLSKCEILV